MFFKLALLMQFQFLLNKGWRRKANFSLPIVPPNLVTTSQVQIKQCHRRGWIVILSPWALLSHQQLQYKIMEPAAFYPFLINSNFFIP